ncbi:MAG: serine aminopeptidase domain-containing protein [Syntrophales bacterium]
MKNRLFFCIVFVLTLLPVLIADAVMAKQEIVTLTSRYDAAGGGPNITLSYLLDTPATGEPKALLIVIPGGNGVINLKTQDGKIRHRLQYNLFIRSTAMLHDRSIGLAMPDVPSDRSKGMSVAFRKSRDHAADLKGMLSDLRSRYPKSKIYFATSGSGGVSALFAAESLGRDLDGVILAGADTSQLHAYDHSAVKTPVLMIHHLEDGCDSSPAIEAREIAQKYSFTLFPFSGGDPDKDKNPCFFRTRHGFLGLEARAVAAISDWIDGKKLSPPAAESERSFLNEKVIMIPWRGEGGEVRLQTTVYQPDGPGPFPLAIISHGVPFEKMLESEIKSRHRYCLQSEEFVKRGFAVAIPMRRGYGRSGGSKNEAYGNITAFGLEDAKDIRSTIDFMRREPYVDGKKILLVGQSGGGLASLAYGSLADPDVKGIINFTGGLKVRKDMWEYDMASAFGIYAKTTRIPSLWFYTENDSYFSPTTAGRAYEEYRKNGGQARLIALPPFKKDGHGLFADSEGRSLWVGEVEKFLAEIGFAPAAVKKVK